MSGKVLTVSVAAYNMEKYIRRTLDSLTDERVVDELEVFVVDDGGTDSTLAVAQEYAARYPGSIIPVHKENGGYGTTVNHSIAHATGKYFKLLDGDDWFDPEGLARLVALLRRAEEDVIVNTYFVGKDERSLQLVERYVRDDGNSTDVSEIGKRNLDMWALAFKTQVLRRARLRLPAHMLYTDRIFSTVPFAYAESVRFCNFPVYCYQFGRDDQSVSRSTRIRHRDETLRISRMLCAFYEQNRDCSGSNYIRHRTAVCYLAAVRTILLDRITIGHLAVLKEFDRQIKKVSPDVFSYAPAVGRTGIVLTVLRRTKYLAYWLFALVPKRVLDFRFHTVAAGAKNGRGGVILLQHKDAHTVGCPAAWRPAA